MINIIYINTYVHYITVSSSGLIVYIKNTEILTAWHQLFSQCLIIRFFTFDHRSPLTTQINCVHAAGDPFSLDLGLIKIFLMNQQTLLFRITLHVAHSYFSSFYFLQSQSTKDHMLSLLTNKHSEDHTTKKN